MTQQREPGAVRETDWRRMLGRQGEALAAAVLEAQGYTILERNYRCRCGEIDLIALRGGTLAFVEVKTRCSTRFGGPAEAVDRRKQQTIRQTAAWYLRQFGSADRVDYDFQVMEIAVRQIPHAF